MPWLFASYPSPLAATARDGSSLAPPRSSTSRASSADSRRAKICSRERRSSRQDQISARPPAAQTVTIRRASVLPTLSELIHEYYYYILRCATHILTCPSASVCSWQRNCRFGIGAAAWQACSRVRSCTPSADQCSASIALKLPPPSTSGVALGNIGYLIHPQRDGPPGKVFSSSTFSAPSPRPRQVRACYGRR